MTTHNIKPVGAPDYLYTSNGEKSLFGLAKGRYTAPRIVLSSSTLNLKPWVTGWYRDNGYDALKSQELTLALRGRPVYALRGRAGRIALLFGKPGATELNAIDAPWFREAMLRPQTAILTNLMSKDTSPSFSVKASQIEWANGPGLLERAVTSQQEGPNEEEFLLWRSRSLLGGVYSVLRGSSAHGAATKRVMPSSGVFSPGVSHAIRFGGIWQDDSSLSPENAVLPSGGAAMSRYPWFMADSDLSFGGVSGEGQTTALGRLPPFRMGTCTLIGADALTIAGACDFMGYPNSGEAGSFFPFPLTSQRLCYAYGLPTDMDFIVWEGDPVVVNEAGSIGLDLVFACTDVTSQQYKKLYPIASLPEDMRAAVTVKFDELPGNVRYRVALFPDGLKYGSLLYDETKLAKDLRSANSTLDELLFDDLEDGRPPIGYGSLGAKSVVTISKKRNIATAICLATEGEGIADLSAVNFSVISGVVVATQGGVEIDSGQAMVLIRSGAATSFDGVTADQVAIQFFALPTWADVIGFSAEAEASDYLVDENVVSNELLFDIASDDEIGRVLPLLLGFERNDFALTVGSTLVGMTSHIKVKD